MDSVRLLVFVVRLGVRVCGCCFGLWLVGGRWLAVGCKRAAVFVNGLWLVVGGWGLVVGRWVAVCACWLVDCRWWLCIGVVGCESLAGDWDLVGG